MSSLRKGALLVVVAATIGIAIYEARRTSGLLDKLQRLDFQQASLANELARLQRERDEATNRLASLKEEITKLQSQQNSPEVLKLRGQVGMLRQQLAVLKAEGGSQRFGFSKMLGDPTMREYIRQNQMELLRVNFKDLFKELKLTPEQTQKAVDTLSALLLKNAEKMYSLPQGTLTADEVRQAATDREKETLEQLKPVLGEAGVARFQEVVKEIPGHATVDLLNGRLGANQLSTEQNNKLLQVIKSEPFELTRGIGGDWDPAFWGTQEAIDDHLLQIADSNQRILQEAGGFLSSDQLAQLNSVLTNGISARIAQAEALISKH